MNRAEVSILVKARDEASSVLKNIAKGLAVFSLAADGLSKLAGAAQSLIGKASAIGGEVSKLQRQFGGTSEEASRLRFAFDQTGVAFESGERGLRKFSQALAGVSDLEDGIVIPTGKSMTQMLGTLGIAAQDVSGKQRSMTDIMGDTADVFKNMPPGVEKTTLATKLFGRAGADLLPFLNKGREGLAELSKQSDKLGLTLNQKTLDALKKQKVALRDMNAAIDGVKVQIGVALIPLMTAAAVIVADLAAAFNQKLVPVIQLLADRLGQRLAPAFAAVKDVVTTFAQLIGAAFSGDIASAADAFNKLPAPLQAVAVFMALVYEVGFQVWQALKDIAEIGGMVVDFLNDLRGKFDGVLPGTSSFADQLVKLGDQKGAIEAIATAIALMITAMIVKVAVDFAAALAQTALEIIKFPIDVAKNAAGAIADFVKAAAGLVSKAVEVTVNVVGNALEFLTGLASGALQRLVNALPALKIPVKIQSETGALNLGDSGKRAGASWLAGLRAQLSGANISNMISNILAGVASALAVLAVQSTTISVAAVAGATATVLGIAAAAAAGIFITVFSLKLAAELQGMEGFLRAVAMTLVLGPFGGGLSIGLGEVMRRIPDMLAGLPQAMGEVIGRAAVIWATLPLLIFLALARGLQIVVPQIVSTVSDIGSKIADGVSAGFTAGIPKITAAFRVAFDPQTYIDLALQMIAQIALTIADPSRILTAIVALGEALKTGMAAAAHLVVESYFAGIGAMSAVTTFVLGLIDKAFGDFFHGLAEGARDQWASMNSITEGKLNEFVGLFATAWDTIKWATAVLANVIAETLRVALAGVLDPIDWVVDRAYQLRDAFFAARDAVGEFINKINIIPDVPGVPGWARDAWGAIPGRAAGIRNAAQTHIAMVGEDGRELMVVPRGASIYSNAETERMLAPQLNAGAPQMGTTVTGNIYITLPNVREAQDFGREFDRYFRR